MGARAVAACWEAQRGARAAGDPRRRQAPRSRSRVRLERAPRQESKAHATRATIRARRRAPRPRERERAAHVRAWELLASESSLGVAALSVAAFWRITRTGAGRWSAWAARRPRTASLRTQASQRAASHVALRHPEARALVGRAPGRPSTRPPCSQCTGPWPRSLRAGACSAPFCGPFSSVRCCCTRAVRWCMRARIGSFFGAAFPSCCSTQRSSSCSARSVASSLPAPARAEPPCVSRRLPATTSTKTSVLIALVAAIERSILCVRACSRSRSFVHLVPLGFLVADDYRPRYGGAHRARYDALLGAEGYVRLADFDADAIYFRRPA